MPDPSVVLTPEQALAVIRRTCDAGWVQGMLAQPDGLAILNAAAAIAARLSRAIDEQAATGLISEAPAGSPGACTLIVFRDSVGTTIAFPKGIKFVTGTGVELALVTDVPVASSQQTIVLPLATLRQIDLVDTVDPAFDDVLAGQPTIAAIVSPDDPVLYDSGGGVVLRPGYSSLSYVSSTPIDGATMDWLSQHGDERGCRRQTGEAAGAYRARIRQIPDAITPRAIQGAVMGAQAQAALPQTYMLEPFVDQASTDERTAIGLRFFDSPFGDDAFCDDPFGVDVVGKQPFRTCGMPSIREGRAYFEEVVAGPLTEPDGLVLYCDVGFCDDAAWGYSDLAQHPALTAALRAILDECQAKRAAGVQFDLYVDNADVQFACVQGTTNPIGIQFWFLQAPAGKTWLLREGLMSCTAVSDGEIDPAADLFQIVLALADSTFIGPLNFSRTDGLPLRQFELERLGYHGQPLVGIAGFVVSPSLAKTFNLVGTFWTTEVSPP